MRTPKDLVYTESHEWLRVDGDKIYLGITDFAQDQLGDIVFVEIPEVDSLVEPMDAIAVVESVKAVSSIFSPVTGTVLEANEELETSPELLNEDPYENWIAKISIEDESELDDLITAEAYDAYCAQLDV